MQTTYGARAQIYGVNAWDKRADADRVIASMKPNYPQLFGADDVAKTYGVRGIPSVWVIDAAGKVAVADGSAHQAEAYLKKALAGE